MGATSYYGWRTPDLVDLANAPANFLTAMQDAENTVKDTTRTIYTPTVGSSGSVQPSGWASRVGTYRVANGICYLHVRLMAGASTNGGTEAINVQFPFPLAAGLGHQSLLAYCFLNVGGGGVYQGFANLVEGGGTQVEIYFPNSASDTRMAAWRNASNGNSPGTGIPLVPGTWGITTGTEIVVSGAYFV